MVFLRATTVFESGPHIRGRGVRLRPPQMSDYVAWAELRTLSRGHLTPWEPTWARDELTRGSYKRRVRHYQRELRDDLGYSFLIFGEGDDRLMGGVSLSDVRRGVTQSASLGYWLGVPFVGQGRMTAAVEALVTYAFDTLRLHRVEAASMPENLASIRVLERCGFDRVGFAKSYLMIDGAWRDHVLFGRVTPLAETGGGA